MDHDSLLLAAELTALLVLGALGLWRMHRYHESTEEAETPAYDMRRDGQRQMSAPN